MKYYVGIDLGGTNVRVAKVDEEGNIIQDIIERSHGSTGPKELVRDTIFSMLDRIEKLEECEGIGIAVPGPVDIYNRVMPISNNLKDFEDYPLAGLIEKRYKYKIPVYIENDANMAGLAEALLGAGKGKPIVYYLTHSTGIGGALIVNGKVLSGQMGFAGEVGNIIVRDNCPKHSKYLNAGSAESESSGTGLGRKAKELYGEDATSKMLFDKAKEGDEKAITIIDEMADNMGRLLATIGQVVDPHIFVLGGGVSESSELFWPKMIENYHKYFNGIKYADVAKAQLKEPGVLGAALLVKENGKV
ncbi:MAG: ROK family protein [Erysipelotrichaceae bacterium]|nr:ROK family protein [Erysipelotrichaceae bacterium]